MEISDEKKEFIKEFEKLEKPTSQSEIIALMLRFQKIAKEKNISFTKEEIQYIYSQINMDLSEKQRRQVQNVINML